VQEDQVVVSSKPEHLDGKPPLWGLSVLHHLNCGVL
jgi:hypothetical protein